MGPRHPEWFLVNAGTDVVIESSQSCGNTFARKAMEHANPRARVASHSHSWANMARGLRLRKPVVVLLRHRLDAVPSHAVRMRLGDLDYELRRYHRFFRGVAGVATCKAGDNPPTPGLVLAPFDMTVNRFGDVIAEVNTRFRNHFERVDHTDPDAKAAVFEEMDREALSSPSELDRLWRIARPNADRADATREMKARLLSDAHRPVLGRCEPVYHQLLQVGGLSS